MQTDRNRWQKQYAPFFDLSDLLKRYLDIFICFRNRQGLILISNTIVIHKNRTAPQPLMAQAGVKALSHSVVSPACLSR